MAKSIKELDLSPPKGRKYWDAARSWDNEIIYFLLIDRFSNDQKWPVAAYGTHKSFTAEQLQSRCGGNLKGITSQLSYLKKLGISAIWLSPFYENFPHDHHGYAIINFLNVDPRFGTNDDLKNLVKQAHKLGIRVIFDVIINHTGDTWYYSGDQSPVYQHGRYYTEGGWRFEEYPVPVELKNFRFYRKQGQVVNWDEYPETQQGDFFSLKKLLLDESKNGLMVQDILQKIYCYWIRETDCDGFRIDTAKHAGALAVSRFCHGVRNYCELIGKKDFFLFGEIPVSDQLLPEYLSSNKSPVSGKSYGGLDSAIDFNLHHLLPEVIQGKKSVLQLKNRYRSIQETFHEYNIELPPLISFLDNHDQIGAEIKERISSRLSNSELKAALAVLLFFPGIPCLYYGTEQKFLGKGPGDEWVREPMFSGDEHISFFYTKAEMYLFIREISCIRTELKPYLKGDLYFNRQFRYTREGMEGSIEDEMFVFSRILESGQLIIIYNQLNIYQEAYVELNCPEKVLKNIYQQGAPEVNFLKKNPEDKGYSHILVSLKPGELVILN